MGNFNDRGSSRSGGFRGGNGGGRPSYGGNRGGDRGERREVTMHKAVCDECHKSCEVPFRPSHDKPIYCNDCFSSKREDSPRPPRKDFGDRGSKRDFNDGSSSHSSFARPAQVQAPVSDDVKRQLGEMNMKLDRLVSAIEKMSSLKESINKVATPVVRKEVAKIVVAKSPVKKVVKKVLAKKKSK